MPSVLITGKGTGGSWQVRGEQLAVAMGAKALPRATRFNGADVLVCVKRVRDDTLDAIRTSRKPWIWDAVDAWPQQQGNAGNLWTRDEAVKWLRAEIERLKPNAIVFPTRAMLDDSGFEGPAIVLPHHAWPKYARPNPVREKVATIGYEGGAQYLGDWIGILESECVRRGWRFAVNGDLRECDIGVALRHQTGYPPMHWKSNCKLANLQALGLPAVCSPERGYIEFGAGVEFYVTSRVDLAKAFDTLADVDVRKHIAARMASAAPRIEQVAGEYSKWIARLNF